MTPRALLLALPVLLVASCGDFPDGVPIYVGENRIGTLPGSGPGSGGGAAAAAGTGAGECQRLAQRTADPSLNDFQRQAAANYAASLGC